LGWFNVEALAEIQGGFVEREIGQEGPQVELIATGVAVEAAECVLADVDREATVTALLRTV
jgi:hypothetical protein